MTAKTPHKNVYTALAAAQANMGPLIKGTENPHFRKMYADLADLCAAVRTPLTNEGLSYFHIMIPGERDVMRTVLAHGESETRIECDVPLIVSKSDMQAMKSATTYAKRIGLESVTGIAPEDDDGHAAASAPPPPKQAQAKAPPPPPVDDGAAADESARRYKADFEARVRQCMTADQVRALFKSEASARKSMQLTQDEVADLVEFCTAHAKALDAAALASA